jgi:L-ascorbate metabolism protein UlaG (beta-lactamase superfamily)
MKITMIGHSSILIETAGKKILTDPYWSKWGNPAYTRVGIPAKSRQELKDIDCVLISHGHFDHVDRKYLRMIGATAVITPKSTRWLIKLFGGRNVIGIKVGESINIGEATITAVPASHLIATVGFVIASENRHIYFSGDTYYRSFMQDIGHAFQLDVAMMPVTTYRIPMTMGEKQAVQAVQVLKPAVVIPIHLGLRPRSPFLRTDQTPEHFTQRVKESGSPTKVIILQEGECYSL